MTGSSAESTGTHNSTATFGTGSMAAPAVTSPGESVVSGGTLSSEGSEVKRRGGRSQLERVEPGAALLPPSEDLDPGSCGVPQTLVLIKLPRANHGGTPWLPRCGRTARRGTRVLDRERLLLRQVKWRSNRCH